MSTIHKILQRLDASKSRFSTRMDSASPARETRVGRRLQPLDRINFVPGLGVRTASAIEKACLLCQRVSQLSLTQQLKLVC